MNPRRLTAVWLALLTVSSPAAQPLRPNLLFILTEDQGNHLGFVGTPGLRTPTMDALARSGVYFHRAHVVYPVCSASKAALYTGLHNHANGLLNNTPNFFKPADQFTDKERQSPLYPLYLRNRVHAHVPTLIERLHAAGYRQGVTGKLHVAPNEKFPFDAFLATRDTAAIREFLRASQAAGKPWHLFHTISQPHRPFVNSDKRPIRVNPADVRLPACLADTPVVRQDWAEYLASIEVVDESLRIPLALLREAGAEANTVVVFMGDHGPAFPHGKMTPYELGLRVPLIIRAPWLRGGFASDALVSELDLAPTLLDLLGLEPLPRAHGRSLRPLLEGRPGAPGHQHVFAEISHRGPLPNHGLQERSVSDGRWKLIYRENLSPPWRTVQDDSKHWKTWGNRTYDETVRRRDQFPGQFRVLAELDPQNLGGTPPRLEFYDLQADPDEMHNLAGFTPNRAELQRLYAALRHWVRDTGDPAVNPPADPPGF
jgi:N-sulfoglucosamine sulfohydrolase